MCGCELVMSISALACAIAEGKDPEELALCASMFSQLGDSLATIAAQREILENQKSNSNCSNNC